jgi:hypothetical protein
MKRSLTLSGAIGLFLVATTAYAQADVIYIPSGFPGVCGSSLSADQPRCPEAVTTPAGSFCGQGLPGLDAVRSALGIPDCQGNSLTSPLPVPLAESAVQLVLLIDDTGSNSQLLNSLAPTLTGQGDRRMVEPSFRVFTDRLNRSWHTLVVGERMYRGGGAGGQQMPMTQWQERIRRLMTEGGALGRIQEAAQLPGSTESSRESESTSTTGAGETGTARSTPTPSRSEGSRENRAEGEAQTETGGRSSTPEPASEPETEDSETSYTFEEIDMPVPFKRSFAQWRDDVGRALVQEISGIDRSQAYSIARNSPGLRRYHSELIEMETENSHEVYIPIVVMRNDTDNSIESVGLYDDD